ncbi:Glycine betaine transporter [Ensifer sesbaniae]|nr:Glycine betaine transporter [Ensifer sesbaniae]
MNKARNRRAGLRSLASPINGHGALGRGEVGLLAPFVGVLIACISRVRTIRDLVIGMLLIPRGVTWAWMPARS